MDNRALQEDELLVLESIYNSDEFNRTEHSNLLGGRLHIYHELPKDFKIIVKRYTQSPNIEYRELIVSKVPPLEVDFTLPLRYPSESPPDYTISCLWLTPKMLSELCLKLDELWHENKGSEILFIWVDFIKENIIQLFSVDNSITIDDLSTAHLGESSLINTLSCLQIASSSNSINNESTVNVKPPLVTPISEKPRFQPASKDLELQIQPQIADASKNSEPGSKGLELQIQPQIADASKNSEPGSKGLELQSQPQIADASSNLNPQTNGDSEKSDLCDNRVLIKNVDTPIHIILNEYNTRKVQEELMKSQVMCNSCFDEKLGAECTQFTPCFHVFCKECVSCYFETQIKENRIFSLGCLENKCESPASQAQIKEHIDEVLFEKYDKLLLEASLVVLTDIVYCPRKFCNYPVTREPNEKLAICPECKYPFCVLCKMTYHGIEKCKFASGEKRALVLAYQNGDAKQREELELRYGHRQLQALLFDELSTQWISSNSKNCPNCSSPIEKNDGCNKMTCTKCGIFFCWVCGTCLSQDRPYDHFSNRTSKCFNLLFEGANVVDEEFDALLEEEEFDEQF
nr:PREDICTED: E3 ubiquitin-protein ligase RNF14-like [Bemisia tabaci]XP_018904545.1 PREDICTED: E3 ubiquitin-protein ligase RNF14-like [Bemisia tabaci]XP_018904546.1 PREDICTED: E3 ubiquitin-protein ligase RNF14-like [Bemisia tabaci]